jgi:hypothetical protein
MAAGHGMGAAWSSAHVLLRQNGWHVKAKRIYRIYTEEWVLVRTKYPSTATRKLSAILDIAYANTNVTKNDMRICAAKPD